MYKNDAIVSVLYILENPYILLDDNKHKKNCKKKCFVQKTHVIFDKLGYISYKFKNKLNYS